MEQTPRPGLAAFVSIAMWLVAWRLAPGANDHPLLWLVAGMFAFAGSLLMIQWLNSAEARPSPWPSRSGRILWWIRPRGWMLAWGAVYILSLAYGTPHVAWHYPPRVPAGTCAYAGWNGIVHTSSNAGRLNGCSLIRLVQHSTPSD